jgi:hypothetical protein
VRVFCQHFQRYDVIANLAVWISSGVSYLCDFC